MQRIPELVKQSAQHEAQAEGFSVGVAGAGRRERQCALPSAGGGAEEGGLSKAGETCFETTYDFTSRGRTYWAGIGRTDLYRK